MDINQLNTLDPDDIHVARQTMVVAHSEPNSAIKVGQIPRTFTAVVALVAGAVMLARRDA